MIRAFFGALIEEFRIVLSCRVGRRTVTVIGCKCWNMGGARESVGDCSAGVVCMRVEG